MVAMYGACSLEEATFAQCMFGADTQKYSTFWFTPGLAPHMRSLRRLLCTHAPGTHGAVAGGVQLPNGSWNSAASAAYPADLNLFIAESLLALRVDQETPPTAEPHAPERSPERDATPPPLAAEPATVPEAAPQPPSPTPAAEPPP